MSKRGMDFLKLWMGRHLAGPGDAPGLALRCAAVALPLGISLQEIEEESGPLETCIAAALAQLADRKDVITEDDD